MALTAKNCQFFYLFLSLFPATQHYFFMFFVKREETCCTTEFICDFLTHFYANRSWHLVPIAKIQCSFSPALFKAEKRVAMKDHPYYPPALPNCFIGLRIRGDGGTAVFRFSACSTPSAAPRCSGGGCRPQVPLGDF